MTFIPVLMHETSTYPDSRHEVQYRGRHLSLFPRRSLASSDVPRGGRRFFRPPFYRSHHAGGRGWRKYRSFARSKAGWQAILYVSRRLDEILAIADRVSALWDGRLAGSWDATANSERFLIELIVGRLTRAPRRPPGVRRPLEDGSFDVRAGEILGVAGLLGTGGTELLRGSSAISRRGAAR